MRRVSKYPPLREPTRKAVKQAERRERRRELGLVVQCTVLVPKQHRAELLAFARFLRADFEGPSRFGRGDQEESVVYGDDHRSQRQQLLT